MSNTFKLNAWAVVVVAALGLLVGCDAPAVNGDQKMMAGDKPADHHAGMAMAMGEPSQAVGDITLDGAHKVMMGAMKRAGELKLKMDIAVVDAGGNLKAFVRMDGAWLGSIDIAIRKARTARYFDMPTGAIGELSQPGKPLYQIEASNGGLITFPGGVPLHDQAGNVIGAVGVSGSTVENDHDVASAGAAALTK